MTNVDTSQSVDPFSYSVVETGWLLDNGLLCAGVTSCGFDWVPYTSAAALRFARAVDAEAFGRALKLPGQPVEHSWG